MLTKKVGVGLVGDSWYVAHCGCSGILEGTLVQYTHIWDLFS